MRRAGLSPLLVLLAVAGCGDDGGPAPTNTSAPAPATLSTGATPATGPTLDAEAFTPEERRLATGRARTQAARFGTAPAGTSRPALVTRVERAVLADARRRDRAGELDGPFRFVECTVLDEDAARGLAPVLRYECLAVSFRSPTRPRTTIGRPFLARVDFPRARFAWCRFTPVGGEGTHAASTFATPPPPACAAEPE